jgi:hypothetical protein
VLNSNAVSAPKRIAPFDTGAWKEGLYSKHLHPAVRMEDFLLDPSLDMPPRLVKKFFRSNSNYYLGNPISIKIPPMEFEAQMYYEIIKTRATKSLDDRGSAIEIQSDSSLILNMANVLFVVLPKVFLDQKDIRDIINKKWGASFGTYDIHQGNVEEMMGKVYERVQEYLSKGGYL